MPVMNGIDVKLLDEGYDKPMTANVMEEDIQKYKDIGMSGCIPKPFKIHDIVNTLDGILGPKANIN